MAMLSISAAAKVFDVSRPTLQKHLKKGKISGKKDADNHWQIDTAELARVYQPRPAPGERALPEVFTPVSNDLQAELKAENERLKAELARAEGIADERLRQLDQLVPLLTNQTKRTFWQKLTGR